MFSNTSMVLSVILTYLSWIFVSAMDGNALLRRENGGKFLDPLNFDGARHLLQSCHSEIETNYFEVMIQIEPGQVASDCSLADLNMLGHDLNAVLLDYVSILLDHLNMNLFIQAERLFDYRESESVVSTTKPSSLPVSVHSLQLIAKRPFFEEH
jgi:hypothetical protein